MTDGNKIDEDYFNTRITAYKVQFPDLDCIGWYSADAGAGPGPLCDQPSKNDIDILKNSISKFAENPYMLIMNENS